METSASANPPARSNDKIYFAVLLLALLVGLYVLLSAYYPVISINHYFRSRPAPPPPAPYAPHDYSTPAQDRSSPDFSMPPVAIVPGPPVDLKTTTSNDFPRFLGPDGRLTVSDVSLNPNWDKNPPKQIWRQPIGLGLSAFSIVGNYACTQEQRGDSEIVDCYELTTGHVRWSHSDAVRFNDAQGGDGPRATPTIFNGKVYSMGATGILNCLDGQTGALIWTHNILVENRQNNLQWGKACSPLVFDNLCVVNLGDSGSPDLIAYKADTGEFAWKGGHDTAQYSSPTLATIGGKQQILEVNTTTVAGHDPADGSILWEYAWQGAIKTSQPVPIPGDKVFCSCGYGVGCVLLQVTRDTPDHFTCSVLWRKPNMKTQLTNVVYHDGYIYGLDEEILSCVDIKSGQRKWKEGRYGAGQVLLVGDLLLVMADDGELTLCAADPTGPHVLGHFSALHGRTWNNMALAGKYLLVRNTEEAACYELPLKEKSQLTSAK